MHNTAEPERGGDGKLRRSGAREHLEGTGALGAIILENGVRLGTGLSARERSEFWKLRDELIGHTARYKFMPSVGDSEVRHPVYVSCSLV